MNEPLVFSDSAGGRLVQITGNMVALAFVAGAALAAWTLIMTAAWFIHPFAALATHGIFTMLAVGSWKLIPIALFHLRHRKNPAYQAVIRS